MMDDRNKIQNTLTSLKYWAQTSKIHFNRSFPNFQALTTCKYQVRLQVILPLNTEITIDLAGLTEGNDLKVSQTVLQVCLCFSAMTTLS